MESEIYSDRVCNIDYILNIRLVAGLYNYLKTSAKVQLLIKIYCMFITILLLYNYYKSLSTKTGNINSILILTGSIEVSVYCVISIYYEDKYILRFYSVIPIIDGLPNANRMYKLLNKILLLLLTFIVLFKCTLQLALCFTTERYCTFDGTVSKTLIFVLWIVIDYGRFSMILLFSLFYCRVTVILDTLTTKGFNNSRNEQLSPEKYVEMIEALMNAVKDTDDPLKILVNNYYSLLILDTI